MVPGEISKLTSLVVHDLGGVVEVLVNELLVRHVNQWAEVGARHCDQAQAPKRKNLDEPVGENCCCEGGNCVGDVLGEEDALELDHEEVDELLDIFETRLESFPWDSIVFLGAEG